MKRKTNTMVTKVTVVQHKREQRLVLTVLLLQLIDHLLSIIEKLTK